MFRKYVLGYQHIDFTWAHNADEYEYDDIVRELIKHALRWFLSYIFNYWFFKYLWKISCWGAKGTLILREGFLIPAFARVLDAILFWTFDVSQELRTLAVELTFGAFWVLVVVPQIAPACISALSQAPWATEALPLWIRPLERSGPKGFASIVISSGIFLGFPASTCTHRRDKRQDCKNEEIFSEHLQEPCFFKNIYGFDMPHDELLDFCYVVGMVVGCPRQRAAMDHIFRESHVVGTRQSTCLKLCLSCYPYPVLMRHRQGLSCLQSLSAGIRFQFKTSGSRYLYRYLVGSIIRFKRGWYAS